MQEFELFEKINKYNTIIIHRHSRPDLDALGSQIGLKELIKSNFNNKNVYVVGDISNKYSFIGNMDTISDEVYKNALSIICDVAVMNMVSDDRYKLASEVIVIDHHKNSCDITDNYLVDTSCVACSEYITHLFYKNGYNIPSAAATPLYGGIVTDSGRFQFGEKLENTFLAASILVKNGANPKFIYDNINVETLNDRKIKNYFSNQFKVIGKVAYLINEHEVFEKFNIKEFNDISRGMLSVMAGIKEIEIWCNFTFDINKNAYIGEFRSRNKEIVDIAKKYGGGGHPLACGATIESLPTIDLVLKDFCKLLEE